MCNDLEPGRDRLCRDVTNYGVCEGLLAGGTVWEVGTSGLPAVAAHHCSDRYRKYFEGGR